jgi:hypothetical protein
MSISSTDEMDHHHPFRERSVTRHNGSVDLESATRELYRVSPSEFTAARDAMAMEARRAGDPELASSLKELRRPSVGAWLANLLARELSSEVQDLVDLGAQLRMPKPRAGRELIRKVSKEKGEAVSELVREAEMRASRAGQPVSAAASHELAETLDAAFADPSAAERLLEGRLSSGLQYSGLGFCEPARSGSMSRTANSAPAQRSKAERSRLDAARSLERASEEAKLADAQLEEARIALAEAVNEVARLKSAEAVATRRSKASHKRASAAKRKLDDLR